MVYRRSLYGSIAKRMISRVVVLGNKARRRGKGEGASALYIG